jgi:ATP-dependent DNA helicase PIF1
MIPYGALDCVDRLLRDLMVSELPFGGKVMILGGDFRQLLPVVPRADEAEIIANTILHHYTMQDGTFRRFTLTQNMRLLGASGEDMRHRQWLIKLGDGSLEQEIELHPYATELPRHLCMEDGVSVEDFVSWVYPDILGKVTACLEPGNVAVDDTWFCERAILTPLNALANQINDHLLECLDPATDTVARSIDTVADAQGEDSVNFPTEFLHTLEPSGLPPHELHLRKGAIVIILRNLDKGRGICNGCRCIVLGISPRMLDVRILTGRATGKRMLLPRIPFRSSSGDFPFILRRKQFKEEKRNMGITGKDYDQEHRV